MKKYTGICVAIMFAIITIMVSCTKKSEDMFPINNCDTTNVKYSVDIVAILQTNCYRCHGAGNTGGSGGILLEGYVNLSKWANNGYLVGNVTHAPGYIPMPYGQAQKISACEINRIIAWVNQGSKNN